MEFCLSDDHKSFLDKIHTYIRSLHDDESLDMPSVIAEHAEDMMSLGENGLRFIRRLGTDGWLGIGTPKQYGGQGLSYIHQWLFNEELKYLGLPTGQLLVQSIIPALAMLAPEPIREKYLPECLAGEMMVAIGYSEPDAGTDLAALKTQATKTEGGYVLNGQKIWTTNAHNSTHLWLAARTGAPDSRHKGITLFLLPLDSDGVSITPIITQGGERTNQVFFSDVFIPEEYRLSEETRGWSLIMAQLSFERTL